MKEIKIFSGKSYPELAKKVCRRLGISLSPLKIKGYANGCFEVILEENVCNQMVFLIQTSLPDTCYLHENLWELFQMISAALNSGAKEVIVVMPYVSYSRSDKIYTPGMSISGDLLVGFLETAGMRRFIGIDFHSKEFRKFFSETTKLYHLSAMSLIAEFLKKRNLENTILLPADEGILKSTAILSGKLNIPIGTVKKTRISDTEVKIEKINGEVTGKNVILLDDEISPLATTVRTLGKELEKRGANNLTVAVTHASIFQKTIRNLQKLTILKEFITTDTIPITRTAREFLPLKVLSIAGLLAKTIRNISEEN